ncbi:LysR substrate-binding domain-containing protein [uncultured Piscinibacter sp.]|uniref:LysR substrate-binding domain-containing protein n=1 Tax=uncultured Piscinibacter sp. TaxID=1131835 RepID=UPI00261E1ED3|nr:LysR substrate-binding domain-containing protein [uncultured Piscinibacter sp.]
MTPPDIRFPSIEGLRAFEAAARLGSFERAAEELHVTASAVGKRIAALEDLLGTPLFSRGPKALALTATGKEYLAQVGAALGLLAAVPLHRRTAQRIERLRISAPPTFARQILVPALERFTAVHPHVELEVVLSIPYLDAAATEADVEVRHGDPAAHSGMPLLDERVLPLASPALLQRLPPLAEPRDLRQAPLLRTPLEPWAPWFASAGLAWDEPAQGTKLVDLGLTLEAAVSGQGIALARPSLARHWLAGGALVPVSSVSAPPAFRYYLLPHAEQGPAADFAVWLRGECDEAARAAAALISARA